MMKQLEQIYGPDYMQMMGGTAAQEKHPGFVVMIEGYSPYKRIGDLLDPPNVKDDPSRVGVRHAAGESQAVPESGCQQPLGDLAGDEGRPPFQAGDRAGGPRRGRPDGRGGVEVHSRSAGAGHDAGPPVRMR